MLTEEHNTQLPPHDSASNGNSRRDTRTEFRRLYGELNPQDPQLIALLSSLLSESLQEQLSEKSNDGGCSQTFIDSLPRISIKNIKQDEMCSICFENFHEDEYPLIVKLPHCGHIFDLQCIAVWLSTNKSCPVCRDNVMEQQDKLKGIDTSKAELEEDWGMYG